ncbi:MAG: hypothetical protein ABR597_13815 [Bacteroidales bacterium]
MSNWIQYPFAYKTTHRGTTQDSNHYNIRSNTACEMNTRRDSWKDWFTAYRSWHITYSMT